MLYAIVGVGHFLMVTTILPPLMCDRWESTSIEKNGKPISSSFQTQTQIVFYSVNNKHFHKTHI